MRPRSPTRIYPLQIFARNVSNYVTFTSVDRSQKPARSQKDLRPNNSYKLRVPLLKSPTHFGHSSSRVNRLSNEDKYSANVLDLQGRVVFNFNIFDGHGGEQCLTFLLQKLADSVELASPSDEDATDALLKNYATDIGGYWRRWYKHKDQNIEKMQKVPHVTKLESIDIPADDLSVRIPMAYLAADYAFFNEEDNALGSTCTSAYLETIFSEDKGRFQPVYESYYFNRHTVSKLTVAQVGDTKAIMVDRQGEAHALTDAHHPSNPAEALRLRRYLANYFMTDSFGEERFISLANTRSFGDLKFKEMGVTAEPDVAQLLVGDSETILRALTPSEIKDYTIGGLGGDEAFLLLCTDGVTTELTDQEIADIVMVNYNLRGHHATPQLCAEEVIKFLEYIGGDDNATCLVVRLNGWGKWPVIDRTGQLRQERLNAYQPRDRGN
ncbi:protein phosphatase PTC6 [Metschnikowia aff. pulcherrima]|uniref:Protein phosphatase PTC6 n=1 Tax=Metschnikowia aff. pulcherrima TaxID=2163413 RepID=A0A4P6XIY2_9ASCO|nr:protein phosphatase PTC6 [Metschnikowia aff. pulcherrima]